MPHAEKCPVCRGSGKLPPVGNGTADTFPRPCHGCNGRGWITTDLPTVTTAPLTSAELAAWDAASDEALRKVEQG